MRIPLFLFILLLLMVLPAFLVQRGLEKSSVALDQQLNQLQKHVSAQKGPLADQALNDFKKDWRRTEPGWSFFTDHREIDEIELAIVRLESCLSQHETGMALAELGVIQRLIQHIPLKEKLTLGNIL